MSRWLTVKDGESVLTMSCRGETLRGCSVAASEQLYILHRTEALTDDAGP